MRRLPVLPLFLVLALAACNDPLEPNLSFFSEDGESEGVESATATSTTPGAVRISGTVEVANNCQRAEGSVTGGNVITLTVRTSGSTATECGAGPAYIDYVATVGGLGSGTYGVVVVHTSLGSQPRTVLDQDLFVE